MTQIKSVGDKDQNIIQQEAETNQQASGLVNSIINTIAEATQKSLSNFVTDLQKINEQTITTKQTKQVQQQKIIKQQPFFLNYKYKLSTIQQLDKKEEELLKALEEVRSARKLVKGQLLNEQARTKNSRLINPEQSNSIKLNGKKKKELEQQKMSRQNFEKIVKEMAANIRTRVKKTPKKQKELLAQSVKIRQSSTKFNIKLQNKSLKLPYIKRLSYENQINMRQQQTNKVQNLVEKNIKKEENQILSEPEILANSIVTLIIKKALQKIAYKEKLGLKLDPTNHKYPVSSFRKKILQEKKSKKQQKLINQSLKFSMLSKRRQIFQSSRYK